MMKQPLKTLEYYEYSELMDELEEKTGKDARNWKNKTFGTGDETEYCDFWHFMYDHLGELLHNGCYVQLDFNQLKYDYEDFNKQVAEALSRPKEDDNKWSTRNYYASKKPVGDWVFEILDHLIELTDGKEYTYKIWW